MENGYVGPSGTPPNIAASSITASSCSSEEMPPHFVKKKDVRNEEDTV
jgi:hypothetical protein